MSPCCPPGPSECRLPCLRAPSVSLPLDPGPLHSAPHPIDEGPFGKKSRGLRRWSPGGPWSPQGQSNFPGLSGLQRLEPLPRASCLFHSLVLEASDASIEVGAARPCANSAGSPLEIRYTCRGWQGTADSRRSQILCNRCDSWKRVPLMQRGVVILVIIFRLPLL